MSVNTKRVLYVYVQYLLARHIRGSAGRARGHPARPRERRKSNGTASRPGARVAGAAERHRRARRRARRKRHAEADRQPGAAGRRRAWRLRLGRARHADGGRPHRHRGHLRHQRRRHERHRAGLRLRRGRTRGRAGGAGRILAPHRQCGLGLAAAALPARPHDAEPRPRLQPGLPDLRSAGARVLALPVQSHELQSRCATSSSSPWTSSACARPPPSSCS